MLTSKGGAIGLGASPVGMQRTAIKRKRKSGTLSKKSDEQKFGGARRRAKEVMGPKNKVLVRGSRKKKTKKK